MTIQPSSSAPRATTMPVNGSASAPSASVGHAAPARAATAPQPALPGGKQLFHIDLTQGRELTSRQWWSLHAGHLRRDRKLAPGELAQRVLHKLKSGREADAAALLNRFFSKATTSDGPAWLQLARRYALLGATDTTPTPKKDALDLYRAAQAAGVLRDSGDVVCMAQLLVHAGAAGEAIGLIAGQQIVAPRDPHLATWSGIAWLAQACEQADTDASVFASAQDRAVKALHLASALNPNSTQAADNAALAQALYPGPTFGNIARSMDLPTAATPNLRAAVVSALDKHTNYFVRRMYAVGTAVRTETSQHRRQQNVDAITALRRNA